MQRDPGMLNDYLRTTCNIMEASIEHSCASMIV